ncbi:hypothetical protein LCGC14_2566030 [marine sediment metagenome]|uniref:Uncharacterized protein n=2 Tax=marine sediment metagenome TaxID=412755 RepID=A0A0F9AJ54_9ZZZZ
MPVIAVWGKLYADKVKLETQDMITTSHQDLVDIIALNKTELLDRIGTIHHDMTVNKAEDKHRDYKISEMKKEIDQLKKL